MRDEGSADAPTASSTHAEAGTSSAIALAILTMLACSTKQRETQEAQPAPPDAPTHVTAARPEVTERSDCTPVVQLEGSPAFCIAIPEHYQAQPLKWRTDDLGEVTYFAYGDPNGASVMVRWSRKYSRDDFARATSDESLALLEPESVVREPGRVRYRRVPQVTMHDIAAAILDGVDFGVTCETSPGFADPSADDDPVRLAICDTLELVERPAAAP